MTDHISMMSINRTVVKCTARLLQQLEDSRASVPPEPAVVEPLRETAICETLLCEAVDDSLDPGIEHVNAARDDGSLESFDPITPF